MGGGLNFLNKKTWHPARPQNLEEVWKREQKAAAEAKKAEELRKQLEEERKRSEFVQMAMDTGHLRKEERLDWMYGSGLQAKQDAEKRREDMLTGKAEVVLAPEQKIEETSRADQVAQLPSFLASNTPASQNETWLRLNNDPLFAIKRQQQEQLSKLRENPVKMMELLKSLTKATEKGDNKDKKEKKEKKDKKSKKSKKRERDSDNSSEEEDRSRKRSRSPPAGASRQGGPDYDRPPPPRSRHDSGDAGPPYPPGPDRPRTRSPGGRYDAGPGSGAGPRSQSHLGHHHRGDGAITAARDRDWGRDRDREPDRGRASRDQPREARQEGYRCGQDRHDGDRRDEYDDRGYDKGYDRRRADEVGPSHRRHDDDAAADRGERGQGRDWERERDRSERGPEVERGDPRRTERDPHGAGSRRDMEEDRQPGANRAGEHGRERGNGGWEERRGDRGSSPGRRHQEEERRLDDRYGLKHSAAAPEVLRQAGADAATRAAETRARLEEARRVREEEERAKAAQRYVRKDFKTGQLTEEERQRRLVEMVGNADEHEAQRRRRLEAAAAADAAEDNHRLVNQANAARGGDAFRDAASKEVFSKLQGSLEARVNSRRHFSTR